MLRGALLTNCKTDYNPHTILPQDCLRGLVRCLEFMQTYEEHCFPDCNHRLMQLLDEVSSILSSMREAIAVYEFLAQVQMGQIATNDNDILDHSDAVDAQLQQYKTLTDNVETIHTRLVRAISAKYS